MLISDISSTTCEELPEVENGVAEYSSSGTASYTCKSGYALSSPREVPSTLILMRLSWKPRVLDNLSQVNGGIRYIC